jgi:hypothetical protein
MHAADDPDTRMYAAFTGYGRRLMRHGQTLGCSKIVEIQGKAMIRGLDEAAVSGNFAEGREWVETIPHHRNDRRRKREIDERFGQDIHSVHAGPTSKYQTTVISRRSFEEANLQNESQRPPECSDRADIVNIKAAHATTASRPSFEMEGMMVSTPSLDPMPNMNNEIRDR